MSILRITLSSWQDLGDQQTATGQSPGTPVAGRILCIPSLTGGAVISAGMHTVSVEDISNVAPTPDSPWSWDLVDPTDADPSGWGWTVRLSAPGATTAIAVLSAADIASLPQVDGVRTADLSAFIGRSGISEQGGLVKPGAGVAAMAVDPDTGELASTMTDGTVLPAPGLPAAIDQLVAAPVRADADRAEAAAESLTNVVTATIPADDTETVQLSFLTSAISPEDPRVLLITAAEG